MKFKGNSVRSLTKLLKIAGDAEKVRLAVPLENISEDLLMLIGFDKNPDVGDYLIPAILGKFTDFNVNGKEISLKHLPLVPEYIMFYGASRDWHGNLHRGLKTRKIK